MTPSIATRFLAAAAMTFTLAGCGPQAGDNVFTGYVEADQLYVSAPDPGWIVNSTLREGDTANAGQVLFQLDSEKQQAAVDQATEQLRAAEAKVNNLSTGARRQEIDALQAQLSEAEATMRYNKAELERWKKLAKRGVAAESRLDQANAAYETSAAKVQTIRANIEVANLAGREAERKGAEAERDAAAAVLKQAQWSLSQRTVTAKKGGRVEEVFQRTGEFVTAGTPLLALLPPDALKVRFFVPQSHLSNIEVGKKVEVSADGQPEPLKARISFIASDAEFTPPVIYSTKSRQKLVFLVEARFDKALPVRPGQPVDVRLP